MKIINKIFLFSFITIFFTFYTKLIYSTENKIIFKINNKAYTTLDYDKRVEYLNFVGNNNNLSKEIIIDDYISSIIFFEYYENLERKENYDNKLNEIFENIKKARKDLNIKIDKKNIIFNIKIDYIRKTILENLINSKLNNLNTSKAELDLLYNINVEYINFEINNNKIINKINKLEKINIDKIKSLLKENNINYFVKQKEITNVENLDNRIKDEILSNNNYFLIKKNNKITVVFIQKKFETYEGIIADIYSVRSKEKLNNQYLNCKNLVSIEDNSFVFNKEYKFIDLNKELKQNLININDYVRFNNDNNENVYIVLCNIKFDMETLKNVNFNKIINSNVSNIEKNFISQYSKIYNLIRINE